MSAPPLPEYSKDYDCGRQMHFWRVPLRPGEHTVCIRCGKRRRKVKRRAPKHRS